jgi:hypothetical protein
MNPIPIEPQFPKVDETHFFPMAASPNVGIASKVAYESFCSTEGLSMDTSNQTLVVGKNVDVASCFGITCVSMPQASDFNEPYAR